MAIREAVWVRKVLNDFDMNVSSPLQIFADNQKAIGFAEEDRNSARAKHIDICYHITRDYINKGFIQFSYIPTANMVADIFTKALDHKSISEQR